MKKHPKSPSVRIGKTKVTQRRVVKHLPAWQPIVPRLQSILIDEVVRAKGDTDRAMRATLKRVIANGDVVAEIVAKAIADGTVLVSIEAQELLANGHG